MLWLVSGQPGRTDMYKVRAFLALHDDVEKDMRDATPEAVQAETDRRWGTLPDRQRDVLASRPRPLSRAFADVPAP